ncbi:DMT family transporter [Pseudomonas sp. JDS28PS106]|uniref:DMT family transporter n=1 Tax=Pseudomonas sp. JDS28PS106 TaxID=2497235 RepID=UPI002FCFBEFE
MHRPRSQIIGMWLMASVAFVFASHDAISKTLMLSLPVIFVAWVRYVVHAVLVSSVMAARGGGHHFKTKRPWLHLLRAVVLLIDSLTFMYGLTHVPLGESTAIVFLAPAFVTLLSPFLFRVRSGRAQWLSVIVGFIGVLMVINPASDSFSLYMLFPLATAFFFALYLMLTQLAGEQDSPAACSFYVGIFSAGMLSVAVPFFWVQPSTAQWVMLLILGCLGLCAHYLIAKSYTYASSATLAPLGYLQIAFATLYGIVLFDAAPMLSTGVGMLLIFASGMLVYGKSPASKLDSDTGGSQVKDVVR